MMKSKTPTEIQKDTLKFWHRHYAMYLAFPSLRDAAAYFSVGTNAIRDRVLQCERKGFLKRHPGCRKWFLTKNGLMICNKTHK